MDARSSRRFVLPFLFVLAFRGCHAGCLTHGGTSPISNLHSPLSHPLIGRTNGDAVLGARVELNLSCTLAAKGVVAMVFHSGLAETPF